MPNIQQFDAGNLALRTTETGTSAREGVARRVGAFYNEQASAEEILARETSRLGGETARLGGETAAVGAAAGQALADTGRRIGSAIEVAGSAAVKYLDHQQISQGAPAFARLMEQKTRDWNERVKRADPNDPTVAQKFMEESVEPALTEFKEKGFYTEAGIAWAESHVDALRKHIQDKTLADMASLAGHAAVVNQQQTINSLSNTVRGDPSSLDFSIAALKSSTEGMISASPNLTGVQAAAARSEILQKGTESVVKSAAMGYIEKTGQVPPWASDPKYSSYINGTELKQFAQAAKYYQRLGESEDKAARARQEHEAKVDFNAKVNELELATMPQKAGDKPTLPSDYWTKLRELGLHPGAALEPGRLKTMVDNGERLTERLNKPEPLGPISHQTTMDLLSRIRGGQLSSNDEIYKAYGDGKLNTADFNFLTKEFKDIKTPEGEALSKRKDDFLKGVGPMIDKSNPLMGKIDATGKEGVYRFTVELNRKIDEYRKDGKNPYDLLDPSKPDYMGGPAALAPFQKTLQESLADTATKLRGTPAPAKREDVMPAVPPPDQRPPAVYETPKGPMRWTGTGWVKP